MRHRDMSVITDGTAQDERLSAALDDHFFDVDPRGFEEIVARCAELSTYIRYYNLANHHAGSWKGLFAGDETVIMAEILAIDAARMEAEFFPLLADHGAAASYLADFSLRISDWYRHLRQNESDAAQSLSRYLGQVIEQRLKDTMQLALLYAPRSKAAEFGSLSAFDPLWGLASGRPMRLSTETSTIEKRLQSAFEVLAGALAQLKPVAANYFANSLRSGNHEPGISLLLSVAGLLEKTKVKINNFSARHRDFYYLDVLKMTAKAQVPDSTILVVKPDVATASLRVAAGTAFNAGKLGGKAEILYLADTDLLVTDAEVRSLYTLYCPRDPDISPEFELGYIDGLRVADVFSEAAMEPGVLPPSRALFGAEKNSMRRLGGNGAVGFAVASSTLQLRESSRTISVTVSFQIPASATSPPSAGAKPEQTFGDRFRRLIFGHLRATDRATDEEKAEFQEEKAEFQREAERLGFKDNDLLAQGKDPAYIFNSVMTACFRPAVTTATGWYDIADCSVAMKDCDPSATLRIAFQMTLKDDAPAIRPYNAVVHGPGFDTTLPVMRFCLDPQGAIYGYSLFCDCMVEEILIESTVSDATRIVAWNQFGQLDTSKPFLPFGPLPTKNSYLVLGNFDSALMNLTELKVNLEWGDLPNAPHGLGEYYKEYGAGYGNDQFLARLSVLSDGRWRSVENGAVKLFDSYREGAVRPLRSIDMNAAAWFNPIDPTLPEEKFRFDQTTRGGFFRIELTAPDTAFGHSEYPNLLTSVLTENARMSFVRRTPRALPPPPYTPSLKRISFTYSAASLIVAATPGERKPSSERAFLLHHFGVESVTTNNPWTFLPRFEHDGNLFIGFSATNPAGMLTLFFHLREDSSKILGTPQRLTWSYLASDRWFALNQNQVFSDTTDGFLRSGVVTLDIPPTIRRNNTIADAALYWLRLSADRDLESFCSLYSVHAQALTVTRGLTEQAPAVLPHALPPGSIKGPVVTIPGLRSVTQLIASRGGRERETPVQQRTRTAERLRHKARAVTPWDYERLILDEFPEVFKVKCFPAMTSVSGQKPSPGSVLIVVIPRLPASTTPVVFDPMLDAISLKSIRDYVRAHSSPQVIVEVRNPVYERIVVRCLVRLQPNAMRQQGYYLGLLNQSLVDYISPWSKAGAAPRFGWQLQLDDVEAFVRRQYYVAYVTQVSMLHLTEDQVGRYRLDDTGRAAAARPAVGRTIYPRYPWSIAIPDTANIIELYESSANQEVAAKMTGLGKLVLGNTFVVMEG
jgi:hypothetical protein